MKMPLYNVYSAKTGELLVNAKSSADCARILGMARRESFNAVIYCGSRKYKIVKVGETEAPKPEHHSHRGHYQIDNPKRLRKRKRERKPDINKDIAAATAAGMTYGKYMLMKQLKEGAT